LGWYDIEQVANAGVEIGSQAVSSRPIDGRPAVALAEVRDNKQDIKDRLGQRVNSFCYSAGRSSPRAREPSGRPDIPMPAQLPSAPHIQGTTN
jgi:hypothetical protein